MPRLFSELQANFIKDNYGKMSYKEMASVLGFKAEQIKKWCRSNIPQLVGQGKSVFSRSTSKSIGNENFFSEETTESYYWAGFIAADGCVNERGCNSQKQLSICLQNRDKEHLEKLLALIKYSGKISEGVVKKEYKGELKEFGYVSVHLTSNKLCQDLYDNFNIVSRKSLVYNPPIIEDDYLRESFIKGYIDGDGYIMKVKNITWGGRVSILGTFDMLSMIKTHIENKYHCKLPPKALQQRGVKNTFQLIITNKICKMFLKDLCRIPVKLERKWENVEVVSSFIDDPRKSLTKDFVDLVFKMRDEGMSQQAIGGITGKHQATISAILLGKLKPMSNEMENAYHIMHGHCEAADVEDAS